LRAGKGKMKEEQWIMREGYKDGRVIEGAL